MGIRTLKSAIRTVSPTLATLLLAFSFAMPASAAGSTVTCDDVVLDGSYAPVTCHVHLEYTKDFGQAQWQDPFDEFTSLTFFPGTPDCSGWPSGGSCLQDGYSGYWGDGSPVSYCSGADGTCTQDYDLTANFDYDTYVSAYGHAPLPRDVAAYLVLNQCDNDGFSSGCESLDNVDYVIHFGTSSGSGGEGDVEKTAHSIIMGVAPIVCIAAMFLGAWGWPFKRRFKNG